MTSELVYIKEPYLGSLLVATLEIAMVREELSITPSLMPLVLKGNTNMCYCPTLAMNEK